MKDSRIPDIPPRSYQNLTKRPLFVVALAIFSVRDHMTLASKLEGTKSMNRRRASYNEQMVDCVAPTKFVVNVRPQLYGRRDSIQIGCE